MAMLNLSYIYIRMKQWYEKQNCYNFIYWINSFVQNWLYIRQLFISMTKEEKKHILHV